RPHAEAGAGRGRCRQSRGGRRRASPGLPARRQRGGGGLLARAQLAPVAELTAPATAAKEEETLGEAAVSADSDAGVDSAAEEIEPAEALEELLEEVAAGLGLDVEVEVEEADGVLRGRLRGEGVGLFIGRRGQTIDAVQHLAQRMVLREAATPLRVIIDADGYRERRAESLRAEADDAVERAVRSGRAV